MIRGAHGHLYTGVTTDIERRLHEHNGLLKGGARYTRSARPYVLAYLEKRRTRSAALKREYAIKLLTRKEKDMLILAQS